jgi:hypothetical protein
MLRRALAFPAPKAARALAFPAPKAARASAFPAPKAARALAFPALLALACGSLLAACGDDEVPTAEVGDCVQESELTGGSIDEISTVDCDDPHYAELIAKFDLDGDDFPGAAAVGTDAQEGCATRFEDYVGIDYASSIYFLAPVTPTEETWERADDREVLCFAYNPDGDITGSVEDAAE